MLKLENIHKVFGKKETEQVIALQGIDLSVKKGEIYGVVGYSGAGKSTLIRCMNLLERPTSGNVWVNGVNLLDLPIKQLREQRKRIGMIFQHYNLLQSKSIFHNVALPLILDGQPKDKIEEKVLELLSFVGLEERKDHYPEQLSGGQKQRVGIARALVTDPHILLCDEATSALDPSTTESVLNLLRQVRQKFGVTILMITHEMNVIQDICDKVAVLENGKIVEQGSVIDIFTDPQEDITKKFVRTVLNDGIPQGIKELIGPAEQNLYRIIFKGASTNIPLLSNTAKQFSVDVNIFYGTVTELQGQPFGNLLINMTGDTAEKERAISFMREHEAIVKEVAIDDI